MFYVAGFKICLFNRSIDPCTLQLRLHILILSIYVAILKSTDCTLFEGRNFQYPDKGIVCNGSSQYFINIV